MNMWTRKKSFLLLLILSISIDIARQQTCSDEKCVMLQQHSYRKYGEDYFGSYIIRKWILRDGNCCTWDNGNCVPECDMNIIVIYNNDRPARNGGLITRRTQGPHQIDQIGPRNREWPETGTQISRIGLVTQKDWWVDYFDWSLEDKIPLQLITFDQTMLHDNIDGFFRHRRYCHPIGGPNCDITCLLTNVQTQLCDNIQNIRYCRNGYTGLECEEKFNLCNESPCQNGGTCTNIESSFTCQCKTGFIGDICSVSECNPNECVNGVCMSGVENCLCFPEYRGKYCINKQCDSQYCLNQGTCVETEAAVHCECRNEYAGNRCEYQCNQGCQRGRCVLKNNQPFCECSLGFQGVDCNTPTDPGNCPPSNPCENGGICVANLNGGLYNCVCTDSWTGNHCNIQVCNLQNCESGVCLLGVGCHCVNGVEGGTCQASKCPQNIECRNGGICEQISLQVTSCLCSQDYTGKYCEYECGNGCGNNGKCVENNFGSFCECDNEHTGTSCELTIEEFECSKLSCKNGGVCNRIGDSYMCQCTELWSGRLCEDIVCDLRNCQNGMCVTGIGCVCIKTWGGQRCNNRLCNDNEICMNNGICQSSNNEIFCNCRTSKFTGDKCEHECLQECINGECTLTESGLLKCKCFSGYFGITCQHRNYILLVLNVAYASLVLTGIFAISTSVLYVLSILCFKQERDDTRHITEKKQQIFNPKPRERWNELKF